MNEISSGCEFIGMLHVPINTILASSPKWRGSLNLAAAKKEDWKIIQEIEDIFFGRGNISFVGNTSLLDFRADTVSELEEFASRLSFAGFLENRMLHEAELYNRHGANAIMLENIVAPYAKRKVAAAISSIDHGTVVLAADTVLTMQGQIFGKPKNENEARGFLQKFSGKAVEAVSGVAAMRKGDTMGFDAIETARIELEILSKETIEWYISTGEPLTRAGTFGISRLGEILVKSVKGSYSCVAGLPKRSTLAVLYQVVGRQNLDDLPAELFNGNLVIESFPL